MKPTEEMVKAAAAAILEVDDPNYRNSEFLLARTALTAALAHISDDAAAQLAVENAALEQRVHELEETLKPFSVYFYLLDDDDEQPEAVEVPVRYLARADQVLNKKDRA